MKKFKLKFFAIILSICLIFPIFAGCSLWVPNSDVDKNKTALVIGEETITKEELSSLYYSFYRQNQNAFYYYTEEQIADIFYRSIIANRVAMQDAKKLIKEGTLIISDEDYEKAWKDVYDSIYSQVDSNEKSILKAAGVKDEDLPERLKDEESNDEKAYKYEKYEFEPIEWKLETGEQATAPSVDSKINGLEGYIFSYRTSKEDAEEETREDIASNEVKNRRTAYNTYISNLMISAKGNKKNSSAAAVLKAEVERLYEAAYNSMVYEKYQEYINSTAAGTDETHGNLKNHFDDAAIVKRYKELLNASKESNIVESNYVSIISSTSNDSLILYHNGDGEYKFFTVQHILVSYEDELLNELKGTIGYDSSKDKFIRDYYEAKRAALVGTKTDIENMKTTYRDKDGYLVKDGDNNAKISIGEIMSAYNAVATGKSIHERTMLFNEYAWKYSDDTGSLVSDKLSGVLGFTITSEDNNHGSFVKEFANGAREMFKKITAGTAQIGEEISYVISDYGIHIMMVTGEYTPGEVVSTSGSTEEIAAALRNTYVSNLTNQSLYEYIYDLIKETLVGSNGTYFSDYRNALIKEYRDNGKIKDDNRLSYEELNDLINS